MGKARAMGPTVTHDGGRACPPNQPWRGLIHQFDMNVAQHCRGEFIRPEFIRPVANLTIRGE